MIEHVVRGQLNNLFVTMTEIVPQIFFYVTDIVTRKLPPLSLSPSVSITDHRSPHRESAGHRRGSSLFPDESTFDDLAGHWSDLSSLAAAIRVRTSSHSASTKRK